VGKSAERSGADNPKIFWARFCSLLYWILWLGLMQMLSLFISYFDISYAIIQHSNSFCSIFC